MRATDLARAGLALVLVWFGLRRAAIAAPPIPSLPEGFGISVPTAPRPPGSDGVGWNFAPFVLSDAEAVNAPPISTLPEGFGFPVPIELEAGGGGEGGPVGGIRLSPTLGETRISADAVLAMIQRIDADVFGGWFNEDGRTVYDVLAIARVESNYTLDAVSSKGAVGLMQVLPSTARQFGPWTAQQMIADPELSLIAGMSYLHWSWNTLARRFGRRPSWTEWFGAYNAGVGNVADKGFIPTGYVRKVLLARSSFGFA